MPIDGVIVEGNTTLNTGALTGESVPRDAKPGDDVISGCINMSGRITVRTTKPFGESTVSKILDLVENSAMKKSKSENFITKFARYYTPAVCYSALALAVLPPLIRLLAGHPAMWAEWITRALTFLVISCPCALVISIPLSFFGGIGCASKNGILVKGSNYLEALADTKYIVCDKTGTLTKGVFQVTGVYPAPEVDKKVLLGLAAYAESGSHHPISQSLKDAYGQPLQEERVSAIQEIAGHGVQALVDGHPVAVGNAKLMEKIGAALPGERTDGTTVYVAADGKYIGCIVISDVVKPTAKAAMAALKENGVKMTVMLTGDAKAAADRVAAEIGMDRVESELLPGDKVAQVEKLLAEKGPKENLAFVGDGINDAPVLSRADVGIAMGISGTEVSKEASDIVLLDDSFATIVKAVEWGRNIYENFKRFISFQLTVNIASVICVFVSVLMGLPAPFTALQLLWINIIMDGPPALTLGLEPGYSDLMRRRPTNRSENIISKGMLARITATGVYMSVVFLLQYKLNFLGAARGEMTTVLFTLFVLFQLFNAFNCRELHSESIFCHLFKNKLMLLVVGCTFVLQVLIIQFAGAFFGTVPLGIAMWGKLFALAFSVIVLSEVIKVFARLFQKKKA